MTTYTALRDRLGRITSFHQHTPAEDVESFRSTLRSTMTAIGAEDACEVEIMPEVETVKVVTRSIAAIPLGLLLALMLIGAINTFGSPARPIRPAFDRPAPTVQPTARPAASPIPHPPSPMQRAYASPAGAILGTIPQTVTISYQHSAMPGWGGVDWHGSIVWIRSDRDLAGFLDLAEPTPAPTVEAPIYRAPALDPPALNEPCDPRSNPRYTRYLQLDPIGSVTGASCNSQAEADANAAMLAEQMRAANR